MWLTQGMFIYTPARVTCANPRCSSVWIGSHRCHSPALEVGGAPRSYNGVVMEELCFFCQLTEGYRHRKYVGEGVNTCCLPLTASDTHANRTQPHACYSAVTCSSKQSLVSVKSVWSTVDINWSPAVDCVAKVTLCITHIKKSNWICLLFEMQMVSALLT